MEDNQVLERIKKVMRVEATVPDRQDFLLTHVPFRNLSLGGTEPITEEKLFEDKLCADPDKHKTIMILGENGSGKSHLIRWLYEKYIKRYGIDDDVEKILWISKAHNTLQDALMQLLKSDVFPEEIRKNELEKIKNAQSALSGVELKKTINFNFTLVIENEIEKKVKSDKLDTVSRLMLPYFLKNEYILDKFLMKEHGPLDRICSKLNNVDNSRTKEFEGEVFLESDFAISLDDITNHLKNGTVVADSYTIKLAEKLLRNPKGRLRKDVANYMNSKVDEVIQRSLKLTTSDFKQLFWSLRTKLKESGMRLTLFVEDINAFTGIDLALMDVLVADHESEGNEEYCRLASVVGTTNDFYKNRLNDSLRDRVKDVGAEVYIREESLFGDKDRLIEFAAKYINACTVSEDDIEEWEKEHDCDDVYLPVTSCKYSFSRETCFGREMSIFPFNRTAICNMYEKLDSLSKTPRRLILDILRPVLTVYYTSPEEFLENESAFKNDSIKFLNDFKKPAYTIINDTNVGGPDAGKRSLLLRVWGNATTEVIGDTLGGLDKEIFDAFGVDMMLEQFRLIGGSDVSGTVPDNQNESQVVSTSVQASGKSSNTKSATEEKSVNETYSRIRKAIGEWAKNSETKLPYVQELRRLTSSFIYGNMEWDVEEIPRHLVENYINSYKYISIEGQGGGGKESGLVIRRNQESENFFYALIGYRYLGGNTWNFEAGFDYYNIAKTWLLAHRNEILQLVTSPYESIVSYQEVLIASGYCMKLFNGGIRKSDSAEAAMYEMFNGSEYHSTIHSDIWNSTYDDMQKVEDCNHLMNRVVSSFSRGVGTADVDDTKYTFVDAYNMITILNKMVKSNWDLEQYVVPLGEKAKIDSWYKSPQIIGIVARNMHRLIMAEMKMAMNYTSYFSKKIPEFADSKSVEQAFAKVSEYLLYLTGKRNLSYEANRINTLRDAKASLPLSKKVSEELVLLTHISETDNMDRKVSAFALNPFDHIQEVYEELQYFDQLVAEKNTNFKSGIDASANNEIQKYRDAIKGMLSRMITCGQEVNK